MGFNAAFKGLRRRRTALDLQCQLRRRSGGRRRRRWWLRRRRQQTSRGTRCCHEQLVVWFTRTKSPIHIAIPVTSSITNNTSIQTNPPPIITFWGLLHSLGNYLLFLTLSACRNVRNLITMDAKVIQPFHCLSPPFIYLFLTKDPVFSLNHYAGTM